MNKSLVIVIIMIVAALTVAYFTFERLPQQPSSQQPSYIYELRHNETGDFGSHEFHDAKIIRINETTDEETIVVQSIKEAIPELKEQFNRTLFKLSYPPNSERLYFIEVLNNTDAPPGKVYAYHIDAHTFSALTVSPYFGAYGPSAVSPDGIQVATTIDPNDDGTTRKLFFINLENDTVQTLITLSGNETLNYCTEECFGGNAGEVKWLTNETIEYGVYDNSKRVQSDFGAMIHPLIEKRTITM